MFLRQARHTEIFSFIHSLIIAIITLTFFFQSNVWSQEEIMSSVVTLDPIVISVAQRIQQIEGDGDYAENVYVFSNEQIEATPARDLGELLAYIPGVDVKVANQFGQPTSVSINGSESRQVRFMVDGIPFNTELSGQANPARIPIHSIQQIEVVKGASSSAWGSGIGGAINIITKDPTDQEGIHGSVNVSFAEFDTQKHSLELTTKVKDLGIYVNGGFLTTDGSRPGADVRKNDVFAKLTLPLGDQAKFVGSFGYIREDLADHYFDPTGFGNTIDQRLNTARYGKIGLQVDQDEMRWNAEIKYNKQDLKTDLELPALPSPFDFNPTISKNKYYGFSFYGSRDFRDEDVLVFGVDFDWTIFKSSPLLSNSKSSNAQAPYLIYTWKQGPWAVIPGIRYDQNENFGSQVSPSFGVVYHFGNKNNSRINFKWAKDFNAPPLLWTFNDGPFSLPNPDLKAERSDIWQLGFQTNMTEWVDFDFSIYKTEVDDAIITQNQRKVNIEKAQRAGAEMILNAQLFKNWRVSTSAAFNDVRDGETLDRVRDQGITRQAYKIGIHYQNDFGFYADLLSYYNRYLSGPRLQSNDRKVIVDAKFRQKLSQLIDKNVDLELFFNIHNISNSNYWSSITFPIPERYFEGGATLLF